MLSVPPLHGRAARVLVVHEDEGRCADLAATLLEEGHEVIVLCETAGVLETVRRRPPDLVLLGTHFPESSGLEVLGDLRMVDELRLVPVLLLPPEDADEDAVVHGLLAGADDVFTSRHRMRELSARVAVQLRNRRDRDLLRTAQKERVELLDAARTDALTGLGNRRAADEMLALALEGTSSLLLLVIDIDHFKRINDTWGHSVGDEVLRAVGGVLRKQARGNDQVARYGGEEFIVVIRDAPIERHQVIAERFHRMVRSLKLPEGLGPQSITASIGAATWQPSSPWPSAAVVFSAADAALYAAKREGRDRVVFAREEEVASPETPAPPSHEPPMPVTRVTTSAIPAAPPIPVISLPSSVLEPVTSTVSTTSYSSIPLRDADDARPTIPTNVPVLS